jgi:hypothetical protein
VSLNCDCPAFSGGDGGVMCGCAIVASDCDGLTSHSGQIGVDFIQCSARQLAVCYGECEVEVAGLNSAYAIAIEEHVGKVGGR